MGSYSGAVPATAKSARTVGLEYLILLSRKRFILLLFAFGFGLFLPDTYFLSTH